MRPQPAGLLAQVDPALADVPPVGQMMPFPFASRRDDGTPNESPAAQVAGSVPPSPPGPPSQSQPPPDVPDDVRASIQQAIVDALLRALSVQPQANQPAFSDQFSTATQPPAFTSPMGQYR